MHVRRPGGEEAPDLLGELAPRHVGARHVRTGDLDRRLGLLGARRCSQRVARCNGVPRRSAGSEK